MLEVADQSLLPPTRGRWGARSPPSTLRRWGDDSPATVKPSCEFGRASRSLSMPGCTSRSGERSHDVRERRQKSQIPVRIRHIAQIIRNSSLEIDEELPLPGIKRNFFAFALDIHRIQ
jgi:hypothetical protein